MSSSDDYPAKRLKQADIKSYLKNISSVSDQMKRNSPAGLSNQAIVDTMEVSTSHARVEIERNTCDVGNVVKHKILGTPISKMKKEPDCSPGLADLVATSSHTVLIDANFSASGCPQPTPKEYVEKWHQDFVRLPCSSENLYPVADENGAKKLTSRWDLIVESLSSNIKNASNLAQCILKYNTRFKVGWDFSVLIAFINEIISNEERENFFEVILPGIARLALCLPQICTQPIPLLKSNQEHSITFSQMQVASLLANAFFCTFPRRNSQHKHSEYFSYPDINFIQLFSGKDKKTGTESVKFEKLKCLLNYFRRVTSEEPTGVITFQRKSFKNFPVWEECQTTLLDSHISSDGLIEEQDGMLQVDFANKFLGGGVLRRGCVQEEISFVLCPELIVSCLFCEALKENEAVAITGCERFNEASGYSRTFKWEDDFFDTLPRDKWNRKYRKIVAIDAVRFSSRRSPIQYNKEAIVRDLNKAFVGFSEPHLPSENLSTIATGNWGCGAFNGNPQLKFLIQLMAASHSGRTIAYFTFGAPYLCQQLYDMHLLLKSREFTVGDVMKLLLKYRNNIMSSIKSGEKSFRSSVSLQNFIKNLTVDESDSDATEIDTPIDTSNDKSSNEPSVSSNSKYSDHKLLPSTSEANDNAGLGSDDLFDDSEDDAWVQNFYGVT